MKRELEFASHPGNLCLVRDFVRQFLETIDLPPMEKDLMVLGIDEACTNVIRYAYCHKADGPMQLACENRGDHVIFRLRDFGTQCVSSQLKGRELDDIQPGGLGIHLIKRAFTGVDYQLQTEGTELVLRKDLATA